MGWRPARPRRRKREGGGKEEEEKGEVEGCDRWSRRREEVEGESGGVGRLGSHHITACELWR
jgi:hypothetical protein